MARPFTTVVLIVKLKAKLALSLSYNDAHWRSNDPVRHGPQVWPWWRLAKIRTIPLDLSFPSTGRRTWCYTRWGAVYFDVVLDRRGVVTKRAQFWKTKFMPWM